MFVLRYGIPQSTYRRLCLHIVDVKIMDNVFYWLQIAIVLSLFVGGLLWPAEERTQSEGYWGLWVGVQAFSVAWFAVLAWGWSELPRTGLLAEQSIAWQATAMYLVYSGVAYGWHLARHRVSFLWRYLHAQHHHPTHLDTLVAVYRHPAELVADSVIVITTACLLGVQWPALLTALAVEFLLESWHHSNLRWRPKTMVARKWVHGIQSVLQTPDMHRIHHEKGAHYGNYGTISLWDWMFGTLVRPVNKSYSVGLKGNALHFLTWQNAHIRDTKNNGISRREKTPHRNGRDFEDFARGLRSRHEVQTDIGHIKRDEDKPSLVDEVS